MAKEPVKQEKRELAAPAGSFAALRGEIDRLFDDFSRSAFGRGFFDLRPFGWPERKPAFRAPSVNFSEGDKAFEITAELPGIEEKDVEIEIEAGMITIKGEKREEKDAKDKNFYVMERSFGSFQRGFRLPENVDEKKISATFKNGVLTVTLPKKSPGKPAKAGRKIAIGKG